MLSSMEVGGWVRPRPRLLMLAAAGCWLAARAFRSELVSGAGWNAWSRECLEVS